MDKGGTALPDQFETCFERRYFTRLYYLALVCDDALLTGRLKQRPLWRETGSDDFIERMLQFNRWLKEHASVSEPPMTVYDSSSRSVEETAREIAAWIRDYLKEDLCEKLEHLSS